MTKTVYLHIGFHKTGTSALQRYLWENRAALAASGINYPAIGMSGPTHAVLANCLRGEPSRVFVRRTKPKSFPGEFDPYAVPEGVTADNLYDAVVGDALHSTCAVTVLSSECFLEDIDPRDVASRLLGRGLDAKIVVYLRRQDSWIQSVINQIVKDRYLRYSGEFSDIPQVEQMDYQVILARWEAAFGRENLVVRVYEKGQLVDDDIVADFLSLCRRPPPAEYISGSERHENLSLHREIVWILRDTNALDISPGTHRMLLDSLQPISDALLAEDGESGLQTLDSDARRHIVERFRNINSEIARRYLGRADGHLFYTHP